jgi:hypothetical protein
MSRDVQFGISIQCAIDNSSEQTRRRPRLSVLLFCKYRLNTFVQGLHLRLCQGT